MTLGENRETYENLEAIWNFCRGQIDSAHSKSNVIIIVENHIDRVTMIVEMIASITVLGQFASFEQKLRQALKWLLIFMTLSYAVNFISVNTHDTDLEVIDLNGVICGLF